MKFLAARDMRNKYHEVIRQLDKGDDIVLTSKGKPVALLSRLSEGSFEEKMARRRGEKAIEALRSANEEAKRAGTDKLTDGEISAEIVAVRRTRKK